MQLFKTARSALPPPLESAVAIPTENLHVLLISLKAKRAECTGSDQTSQEYFGEGKFPCLGGVPWLAAISSYLVAKLHHAAPVGFDLRQMERDVSVELLEERYPITNQDRQDRITNFVG